VGSVNGHARLVGADPAGLGPLHRDLLAACREFTTEQQSLARSLAETFGVASGTLYYHWMLERPEAWGAFQGGKWRYFFHGVECDLLCLADGRFLRIEFGPGGRLDTFTEWSVLQFVMSARSPWRVFPGLQAHLALRPPPWDQHAGSYPRVADLFDGLREAGLVADADPDLCALARAATVVDGNGVRDVSLPAGFSPYTRLDCLACDRLALTPAGMDALLRPRAYANREA
jgi:hypothetical protein